MIGADSGITKNVSCYAFVVSNPAKQIGWVSEYGHWLNFNGLGIAICQEYKQEYNIENSIVKKQNE